LTQNTPADRRCKGDGVSLYPGTILVTSTRQLSDASLFLISHTLLPMLQAETDEHQS